MKNEINYSPQKETTLSAIVRRQAETHADFTYSISGNVVSIVDLDLGNRSVTNDIESVLRKIEHYHQGSIGGFRIMYRDYLPHSIVACSLRSAKIFSQRFLLLYLRHIRGFCY